MKAFVEVQSISGMSTQAPRWHLYCRDTRGNAQVVPVVCPFGSLKPCGYETFEVELPRTVKTVEAIEICEGFSHVVYSMTIVGD